MVFYVTSNRFRGLIESSAFRINGISIGFPWNLFYWTISGSNAKQNKLQQPIDWNFIFKKSINNGLDTLPMI